MWNSRLSRLQQEVQVRPWNLNYMGCTLIGAAPCIDRYAIFVSGIPRTVTAMEVAQLFQQVVSNVVKVILEVEPGTNYPKGSARVVFGSREAYLIAIAMRRFTLFTPKQRRVLEMRPYVFDRILCEICRRSLGVFLCPEFSCLLYYCIRCWIIVHKDYGMDTHIPVSRRNLGRLKGIRQNPAPRRYGSYMPRGYYYFQQANPSSHPDSQYYYGGYFVGWLRDF
ncbi:RNA recognition motif family protein [Acanthocheilonema viteae]